MKKVFLFLTTVSLFFACSKNDSNDNTPAPGMTAKVYGKDWTGSILQALWFNNSISISGTAQDGSSIAINLNDTIAKEYTLTKATGLNQSSAAYTPKDSVTYTSTYYSSTGGTVTISSIDKKNKTLSGTFTLTLARANGAKVTIANGVFNNISYEKELPQIADNSFTGTISGTTWNPVTIAGMTALGNIILNLTDGSKAITIKVPSTTAVGTVTLSSSSGCSINYSELSTNAAYYSTSGSLVITTLNTTTKRIEGNFNATLENYLSASQTKTVTGTFAITYK